MELHVAISQFRPAKADPARSLDGITSVLARVASLEPRPDLVVFPESALTGYFLEGGVREHARAADELFDALSAAWEAVGDGEPLDLALGFYELADRRVYNAALYAELGSREAGIRHVHRKVFLPTYGVFQEDRFVEAGSAVRAFSTRWGRCATLVCEDAFHSICPTLAALDGAEVLLVLSASPARGAHPGAGVPANLERWDRLASQVASEHGIYVVVSQLVGFEGGKGFPGGSTAHSPRGERLARGGLWGPELLPVGLDLEELVSARVEEPLLADLERAWRRLLERSPGAGLGADRPAGRSGTPDGRALSGAESPQKRARRAGYAGPFASWSGDGWTPDPEEAAATEVSVSETEARAGAGPGEPSVLDLDLALVERWLVEFLRDEIVRRRGFERAVVGLSGGVDSSVTATLCARALGPEAVTGFLMPYRTSSPESGEHARALARGLGIETVEISITPAVDGYLESLGQEPGAHRIGNVAARQRMIVLFDQAARLGALPVGTGNKSERLLGYFTWHADDTPPINPLGDLFKVQVWALARHLDVPSEIVEKPASADLIRGQTDEADLGISYPKADLILHHLVSGWSPARLETLGFDRDEVRLVRDRLEGTHWKRHLPTVAVISETAIGEWYLRPVDY